MNPYASYLGDQDARTVLAATPDALAQFVRVLGEQGMERSIAPGKWSARTILCHLADNELTFGFRVRQCASEEDHVIQPYDQDGWALPYPFASAADALQMFTVARRWNLAYLNALPPTFVKRLMTHPERGPVTLQTLLETVAGHDLNHLTHFEAIRAGL